MTIGGSLIAGECPASDRLRSAALEGRHPEWGLVVQSFSRAEEDRLGSAVS